MNVITAYYCKGTTIYMNGIHTISHIYKELNGRADGLSKKGLDQSFGFITVRFYRNNQELDSF